jgi:hypothetical protein
MIEKDIAEKVSTRPEAKIDSEPLEKVLEDRLPQCTNYKIPRFVGLPSSNIIIGDNLYLRWKKSDEDEFLTTIDIIGGYLN